MHDIDTWIVKNPNASTDLYPPSSRERKIDAYALDHCHQMRTKGDKETTSSINFLVHTQRNTITTQVVSISLARGAQKKYYNGGIG
jgi:hypothetical protein